MGVLGGGWEWLVDPCGTSANIPPPTASGQGLGIHKHYSPPTNLHGSMEGSDSGSPSWVAPQSALHMHANDVHVLLGCLAILSYAQVGTPIPVTQGHLAASLRSVVWGTLHIPLTIDIGLTPGLGLSICRR